MSGWDATSRPTWDPQGGTGESTQSFGAPDFAADGGFPGSASPGTPPAIFLQDYDKSDFGQSDFGRDDFGNHQPAHADFSQNDFAPSEFVPNDFGQSHLGRGDLGQSDWGQNDFGQADRRQNGFAQSDFAQSDFAQSGFAHSDFGQSDFAQNDFAQSGFAQSGFTQNDFGQSDFAQNDFGQQDRGGRGYGGGDDPGRRSYDQRGPATRDHAQQDFPRRDPRDDFQRQPGADRGYSARHFADADREDPRDAPDSDSAARMDPALRDFFAPQPARQDPLQEAYGRPGQGARGYPGQGAGPGAGHGQGPGRGGQFGPGLSNGHRQPGPWDTAAQRPGSRTARRQESRAERRGLAPAAVAIGLVVVLGIAIGAYMLLRGKPATPNAGTTTLPTPSATVSKSTAGTQIRPGAAAAGYTLQAPATAGGYAKLASIPASVQSAAGTTAQAIKTAVTSGGGKVTGQVTAAYRLSGGQVLAFTGFEGKFDPAKVMASLATFGTDSHPAAAGPHGGTLACATTPSPNGTVCVWVTTTTMGITEFFASSDMPEVVTIQAKAAADTLKFRAGVEAPKP
jgi:hypothetical protein